MSHESGNVVSATIINFDQSGAQFAVVFERNSVAGCYDLALNKDGIELPSACALTVTAPAQSTADLLYELRLDVAGAIANRGIKRAVQAKVDSVHRHLDRNRIGSAISQLDELIQFVSSHQGKHIETADAARIKATARQLKSLL